MSSNVSVGSEREVNYDSGGAISLRNIQSLTLKLAACAANVVGS